MNDPTTLIKHYAHQPGKLLDASGGIVKLQHLSISCVTEDEVANLTKSISPEAPLSEGSTTPQPPPSKGGGGTRLRWLKMATTDIDRAGDQMVLDGMDATHFLQNPQFLWQHAMSGLPVHTLGCIRELRVLDNALFALAEYATEEVYCFADQIYRLDVAGYLPANSIGFRPIEWEPNDNGGNRFTKWELVECSKVELPMNPNAVSSMASLDEEVIQAPSAEVPHVGEYLPLHKADEWLWGTQHI